MSNIMISADVIDKYWQRMSARTNDEIAVSLRSLHSRQPALMLYLMEADKENLADKERQYLYYLGCFIVEVMLAETPGIVKVEPDVIFTRREAGRNMLAFLGSAQSPEQFAFSMNAVIDAHPQADLFRYVVDICMENAPSYGVRDENIWRLFAHLKITLDCLQSH